MSIHLSITGLESGYAGSSVLHGVDLEVPATGVVAILGRNGVGKTTLINTIMGLIRPYRGSIRLDGRELAGRRPDTIARAGVALVPQGRRVFASLTVAEHLAMAERLGRRRRDNPWNTRRIADLLPRLTERRHHRGDQLSGGEQQMLAIARALLTGPRLLLLDEPSDGLAPAIIEQVEQVIAELAREGMAILLVEQNLRLALSAAAHVAVMEKGRIVLHTTTPEFRADPDRAHTLLGV